VVINSSRHFQCKGESIFNTLSDRVVRSGSAFFIATFYLYSSTFEGIPESRLVGGVVKIGRKPNIFEKDKKFFLYSCFSNSALQCNTSNENQQFLVEKMGQFEEAISPLTVREQESIF
jgi:hypothetical protein